ncbi:MAG: CHASE2 domain-containing protein [Spirochaetaceae bacterium]|jgi:adenylate cyclase|nr:CHASE2 domain-containing protein [Spirochaetaceae bacterium]
MPLRKSILIALASALAFSLLYLLPLFNAAEAKCYDMFLRLAPRRERVDRVVFLDVDDKAIARVGVFPWPRRVMAEALLRLKEYGAESAIFDIEYIDKSPTQVDELYLKEGLALDYDRRFSNIGAVVANILNAVGAGSVRPDRAASYIDELTEYIASERDALFQDTMKISGDDDLLLAQAAALFGNTWGTLNIQDRQPLSGEQAERRPLAERRFSYPVKNNGGIMEGENIDLLPPIPVFMEALKGAGFTNVIVDPGGVRRRIFLAQEVRGRWYLQLTFAPLMAQWGNPALTLEKRRMRIERPDGKEMVIPLDSGGAMLLDWPRENYAGSFGHVSFVSFAVLEEYQNHIEEYLWALASANKSMFPAIPQDTGNLLGYFDAARAAKTRALETCSTEEFSAYLSLRDGALARAGEFTAALAAAHYIENESRRILESQAASDPAIRESILEEARYCQTLLEYLDTELRAFAGVHRELGQNLKDKICVIGRVDTGTTDIGVNPFYGAYVNVGTHAVVLDTIMRNSFITPVPVYWSVLFAFLFVPLLIAGTRSLRNGPRAVLGIAGIVLTAALPAVLFVFKRIFIGPLGPVLAVTAAVLVREAAAFIKSEHEKQFIRKAFSTYVSLDVVKEIIADPSRLQLGGVKRPMSAIFTDVQGFSTISEKLDPEDLVKLLNRYLSAMSDVILAERGTIDKYEGDAIIAFFGAPLALSGHALRSCVSALAMKRIERELNAAILREGLSPSPLLTRIGINTGSMVAGNMGTENKMNYTIMGNAVNLAARLEGVNKQYGTWILASEDTVRETGGLLLARKLDRVRVVGISEAVRLYDLVDTMENAAPEDLRLVEVFHQALDLFESRSWKQASEGFREAMSIRAGDRPSQKYLDRCVQYTKKPPLAAWDGVYNLTEK